jgi:imidazolonepropionase-like amidohydrolase
MRDHLAAADHQTAATMAKHADVLWTPAAASQLSPLWMPQKSMP